ncbi:MAG: hypothetical protein V3W44_09515 [Dehalococcoidales bacterium]
MAVLRKVAPHWWHDYFGGWVFDASWKDDVQAVEIPLAVVTNMKRATERFIEAQESVGRALAKAGWQGLGPGMDDYGGA